MRLSGWIGALLPALGVARRLFWPVGGPQVSKDKARHLIDEGGGLFAGKDVRTVQNGGMRQRFHGRHQNEGRKLRIGDVDLVAMRLQIGAKKPISVLHGCIDIFEPGAGDLFVKDAVKLGVDAVSGDGGPDEFARSRFDRERGDPEVRVANHARQFLRMALDDGRDQRFLAREILVERANADAGDGRNPVGARPFVTLLRQNASSRFDKGVDGRARPALAAVFSGLCLSSTGHCRDLRNASSESEH